MAEPVSISFLFLNSAAQYKADRLQKIAKLKPGHCSVDKKNIVALKLYDNWKNFVSIIFRASLLRFYMNNCVCACVYVCDTFMPLPFPPHLLPPEWGVAYAFIMNALWLNLFCVLWKLLEENIEPFHSKYPQKLFALMRSCVLATSLLEE